MLQINGQEVTRSRNSDLTSSCFFGIKRAGQGINLVMSESKPLSKEPVADRSIKQFHFIGKPKISKKGVNLFINKGTPLFYLKQRSAFCFLFTPGNIRHIDRLNLPVLKNASGQKLPSRHIVSDQAVHISWQYWRCVPPPFARIHGYLYPEKEQNLSGIGE